MRTLLVAALLTAGVGFAKADDPKKADDKAPETLKDRFAALQKNLRTELSGWQRDYVKAAAEDRQKLFAKRMDILHEHGKKALSLGKEDLKSDVALEALTMAFQCGSDKTQSAAGDCMVENFADDAKLAKIIPQLAGAPVGEKLLGDLVKKSKNKNVRGVALYAMLESEIENTDESPRQSEKDAASKWKNIGSKVESLATEYGDVKVAAGREEVPISKAAEKMRFFLDNLIVGKLMPDVETERLDGKKTKISDYRGKVVVLDIWTTWCGPCRGMIPHERELVEKLKDKKFAFISVSADDKKETLEQFLEKEKMPWNHWWDGSRGKLTETLQIRFFPTIYVLDDKGVIRYKHVREKAMDDAVEELLKKMDGAQ